jgi:mono/diheme cytochrome c family protein
MVSRVGLALGAAALSSGLFASAFAQAPSDGLPEDPTKAVVLSACSACHEVGLITVKPRPPEEWDTLLGQMIDRGASLTPDEKAQVRAYLVKNFGAPATPAAPSR